jgi:hypothetical protein
VQAPTVTSYTTNCDLTHIAPAIAKLASRSIPLGHLFNARKDKPYKAQESPSRSSAQRDPCRAELAEDGELPTRVKRAYAACQDQPLP